MFEIDAPKVDAIALIDSKNNWTYLNFKNGICKTTYTPKNIGELKLSVKYQTDRELYTHTIIYHVEKTNNSVSQSNQQLKKVKTQQIKKW